MTRHIELAEQPAPPSVQAACDWLWAAERYTGDPTNLDDIEHRLLAGEALDILTDVAPPYPPPNDVHAPLPLPVVLPDVLAALAEAARAATATVELRLRIARAVRLLTEHQQT